MKKAPDNSEKEEMAARESREDGFSEQNEIKEEKPFAESLCYACKGLRLIQARRGATYLMCTQLPQRYLPQPVTRCRAFESFSSPPKERDGEH
jgi:hypothetical protein